MHQRTVQVSLFVADTSCGSKASSVFMSATKRFTNKQFIAIRTLLTAKVDELLYFNWYTSGLSTAGHLHCTFWSFVFGHNLSPVEQQRH